MTTVFVEQPLASPGSAKYGDNLVSLRLGYVLIEFQGSGQVQGVKESEKVPWEKSEQNWTQNSQKN